jgi:hypothetical protein
VKRGRRFAPRLTQLEGRDVPAVFTFYVDPSIPTPAHTGDMVTFNAGRPDAHTGPFANGTDGSVYNDLTAAIGAANAHVNAPGEADVLRLANTDQQFFVNATGPDAPVAITDSVNFVGAGAGVSILQTDPKNNQPTAVLDVQRPGANPVTVNFSDVTFFGGAAGFDQTGNTLPGDSITGRFIRYEAGTTGKK